MCFTHHSSYPYSFSLVGRSLFKLLPSLTNPGGLWQLSCRAAWSPRLTLPISCPSKTLIWRLVMLIAAAYIIISRPLQWAGQSYLKIKKKIPESPPVVQWDQWHLCSARMQVFLVLFCVFKGLHLQHTEFPRLQVALEPLLLACTTAPARRDP